MSETFDLSTSRMARPRIQRGAAAFALIVLTALTLLIVGGAWNMWTHRAALLDKPLSGRAVGQSTARLRLVSYNVQLLPGFMGRLIGKRSRDDYRAEAIARKLCDYDLVGLCEVFDKERRRQLIEEFQRDSSDGFATLQSPPPTGRALTSGGLLLLTRLKIKQTDVMIYRNASRFFRNGIRSDGFAAKGVLYAQLEMREDPSVAVDCFLTHLESVSSKDRDRQIVELADFIDAHTSPERPVILLGDLNTPADPPAAAETPAPETTALKSTVPSARASQYQRLRGALRHEDQPLVDVWRHLEAGNGGTDDPLALDDARRIDYVLMSTPQGNETPSVRPLKIRVLPLLDDEVPEGSLSDHAAVECVAEVTWKQNAER